MDVFVGIDGGGSRATAVATDVEGRELARVEGGPGRIRLDAPGTGAHVLADLVDHVIREAGARLPAAGLICALAGAGREDARRELAAALLREAVAIRLRVVTDAEAAYQDAFGGGPGILLIAGTGSIAWGRDADGRTIRAGGWGALLGDEGSGYDLGLRALRAVLHAHDGRGPATGLTGTILGRTGVDSPEGLVTWSARADKAEIAALAPCVLEAAEAGDDVASSLVRTAATDLAAHVDAIHERLAPWPETPTLAVAGGLLANGKLLREKTIAAVRAPVRILDRAVDAARGAAAIARAAWAPAP